MVEQEEGFALVAVLMTRSDFEKFDASKKEAFFGSLSCHYKIAGPVTPENVSNAFKWNERAMIRGLGKLADYCKSKGLT